MQKILILEIIASKDKVLAKDVISILEKHNLREQFSNSKTNLKMAVYMSLLRLCKKGYVIKEHDNSLPHKSYRFTATNAGLEHLMNEFNINEVRADIAKVS